VQASRAYGALRAQADEQRSTIGRLEAERLALQSSVSNLQGTVDAKCVGSLCPS
jgi:hypothetical protein